MRYELSREDLLKHCLEIAGEYQGQNLSLTLRQMYYQLVARGLVDSGQKIYKRVGDVLTNARFAGEFPIHWLEDRGRSMTHGRFTRDTLGTHEVLRTAHNIAEALPEFLVKRDRWLGQRVHVSVWVEKQALEGVFEGICAQLGVGLFACKGYPSISSLYEWMKGAYFACNGEHDDDDHSLNATRFYSFGHGFDWAERHRGTCDEAVVLYFGDHDPDGWEIPRSALRSIGALSQTYDMGFPLTFRRIALNMNQIREYDPPPFEAKMTSARYAGYIREHNTEDAWELDALDPIVLRDLVETEVNGYFDEDVHETNNIHVDALRADLRKNLAIAKL